MPATTAQTVIAVVAIDIGKNSFQVVALDNCGAIVLRRKWSRKGGVAGTAEIAQRYRFSEPYVSSPCSQPGPRQMAGNSEHLWHLPAFGIQYERQDWLAGDAVPIAPYYGSNSLLRGILIGNSNRSEQFRLRAAQ